MQLVHGPNSAVLRPRLKAPRLGIYLARTLPEKLLHLKITFRWERRTPDENDTRKLEGRSWGEGGNFVG